MKIVIIGAAGFIGTNLTVQLAKDLNNEIRIVDRRAVFFNECTLMPNVEIVESTMDSKDDFSYLEGQDVIYHLVSTTAPTTSNQHVVTEIEENVVYTARLLDACIKYQLKKIVFISSGGTVYGKNGKLPLKEDSPLRPISSYGMQKVTIENLIYLYNHMYGIDYRIIRLSNPYGPYQRPNGMLGVVTTAIYKALKKETIEVYGDGSVVRDFIFIDDAVRGILTIAGTEAEEKIYNLGSGYGTSINDVIECIRRNTGSLEVCYKEGRNVDVPVNYLDMDRYEKAFGKLNALGLDEGVKKTIDFMKEYYDISNS